MGRRLVVFLTLLAGCRRAEEPKPHLGPDCRVLVQAATRARACDPTLATLAEALQQHADEQKCRVAARMLIDPPSRDAAPVESAVGRTPAREVPALTAAEENALLERPLPSELIVRPDLPAGPGVPPTTAELAGRPLEVTPRGELHGRLAPGRWTLELRHAGDRSRHCLELRPCETLQLIAHGARLARHPRVMDGPC